MQHFWSGALKSAEVMDAWRIVPRILVTIYGVLVYRLYSWYRGLERVEKIECDDRVLQILIDSGMEAERAMEMACNVVALIGGPSTEQTAFVTTIIGLSTGIFGFYVSSGRKWETKPIKKRKKSKINSSTY